MACNKCKFATTAVRIVCCLALAILAQSAAAQYSQSERKQLKTANNFFETGLYEKALPIYIQLDSVIDDINLRYQIGLCYLKSRFEQEKSISYLEEASVSAGTLVPLDVIWNLGDAYHVAYRFEDAMREYNKYITRTAKNDKADINKLNHCKRMITVCRNAIEITEQPYKVDIEPMMSLYTAESDFNPLISADESVMLFMRETGVGKGYETSLHIMISTKDADNAWAKPENVNLELDHKLQNQTAMLAGLSPDGHTVFLNFGEGLNKDIYSGKLQGKTITEVKKLNKNINTPYYEGAASITPDGTKLFFVSDRPGGLGGRDIYVSTLNKKGEWDEPVNLGDKINTKFNEDAPHIHYDGQTLFFSSQGHNTIGGKDIFKSRRTNGQWTEPENLGFTNTTIDDLSFVLNASGEYGYFSTSRNNSYGRQTIMKVGYKDPIPLTLVKGTVLAGTPPKPIKVDIKVYDKTTHEQIKYVYTPDTETGKYLMIFPPAKNYQLVISTPNFMPQLINIHIPYQNYFYELYQEITLQPIKLNNSEIGEEVMVNNVFYDIYKTAEADSITNNNSPQQPIYYEHLLELVENIIQTSDTINKLSYNTQSKKEKAQLKKNTDDLLSLIEDAINTSDSVTLSILDANSKQKDKVTETHFYTDGIKSKSVTMQVIGQDTFYTASPIDLSRFEIPTRNHSSFNRQENINPVLFKVSQPEQRKIVHKHTLYYKLNESTLTAASKKELQQIIDLLIDNASIGAEINGYADTQGERSHNMNLSQLRAQNVLKYLLENNVDGRKIITQGHGESTARGKYDNRTHEMNYRRVEIILFELKD
ncbi:MAG: OmpA family protein [Salinivirgaceae bacterium]|nr:OmpA family protein [Salinivirgaceae bacterium]